MIYRFVVTSPILGYRASKARAFDPEYKAFKKRVRIIASASKVPMELPEYPRRARISFVTRWTKRARIDRTNVEKAIEDALWRRDRRVLEASHATFENCASDSVEVSVEIL